MFLSKSDYMMACGCAKALWLKKNRKDLIPEVTAAQQAIFDAGNEVQNLAREYFEDGVMVEAEAWDVINGSKLSSEMAKKHDVLFEAFALLPWGAFCRIDVMKKNGDGWDLIEIKGSNSLKLENIYDLAFQYYVFFNAGYKINGCYVLHLNKEYSRQGKLDVKELFMLEKVTDQVIGKYAEVEELAPRFFDVQGHKKEPQMPLYKDCLKCQFFGYCGKDVPEYSIFNILSAPKVNDIYLSRGTAEIKEDVLVHCKGSALIDAKCFLDKSERIDREQLQGFLGGLEYPLYYLDYESLNPAIPMFDDSGTYNQIPFQFSLHIQKEKGRDVEHVGFLHKEKTDPRRALAEFLVKSCGDRGSVIVFYQGFEKTRNAELAKLFPDLAAGLLAINDRIVDLWQPFKQRMLYSHKQKSSASIKDVLPAFTEMSYKGMDIANGSEAMDRYLAFMKGQLSEGEERVMFDALDKYCHQDTLAMVKLVGVLYEKVEG